MKRKLMVTLFLFWVLVCGTSLAEEPRVTMVFFETDLREALSELALQTNVNIIADATVQGSVTVDLVNVPLEKALDMLLLSGGFAYQKIDDYYLVGLPDPRTPTFQHLAQTEVVRLKYLSAAEAKALLPSLYDPYLKIGEPTGQVITITAPAALIQRFKTDLEKIDVPEKQVLIKAIITEVSTAVLKEHGVNFFQFTANQGEKYNPNWLSTIGFEAGSLSLQTDLYGQLLTSLRFLEGKNQAEIVANPSIVVTNRGTANLFIGDTQHIILEPEWGTSRLERVDVGVTLKVTPQIIGDNQLRITLAPEVSHLAKEDRKMIVVRRNEIASTVDIEAGQTLTLAGMTLNQKEDKVSKIPFLGEIPLVRWFFRQGNQNDLERELLVFITAEIVQEEL